MHGISNMPCVFLFKKEVALAYPVTKGITMGKITIIGAGVMSSAMSFPAAENGHEVHIVGTPYDTAIIENYKVTRRNDKFNRAFPENVHFHFIDEWKEVVVGSDFLIGGVSTMGAEWFLDEILSYLDPAIPVLVVTKGLKATEDGSLFSYPGYWVNELAKRGIHRDICGMGGPCISYELVAQDPTYEAFCGMDSNALRLMKEMLERPYFTISLTNDVIGLESAVAFKNAYALAVAIAIGMNIRQHGADATPRYNSQAAAFAQAVRETHMLMQLQGGTWDSETVGLGDLFVTIAGGRTRACGIMIGEGANSDEVKEKLAGNTLESLVITKIIGKAMRKKAELGLIDLRDYPLMMHVVDLLDREIPDTSLPFASFTFTNLK